MSNADDTIAADIMAVEVIIFRVTPSYRNSQFFCIRTSVQKTAMKICHRAGSR